MQTPEQVTRTLAGQDGMLMFCWIIVGKKILCKNQALCLRHRQWFWILTEKSSFRKWLITWCRLTEIASLVCWTSLFYRLINQSEFADTSVHRGEQNGFIIEGVERSLPSRSNPLSFFSSLLLFFLTLPPTPPLTPATQASGGWGQRYTGYTGIIHY